MLSLSVIGVKESRHFITFMSEVMVRFNNKDERTLRGAYLSTNLEISLVAMAPLRRFKLCNVIFKP